MIYVERGGKGLQILVEANDPRLGRRHRRARRRRPPRPHQAPRARARRRRAGRRLRVGGARCSSSASAPARASSPVGADRRARSRWCAACGVVAAGADRRIGAVRSAAIGAGRPPKAPSVDVRRLGAVIAAAAAAVASAAEPPDPGYSSRAPSPRAGPRPAARAAERRAHARVDAAFRPAGLRIAHDRFRVPGHGRSRNVVGMLDTPADCLVVLIAHTDSVPPAPGADDNASGVGTLVALAPAPRRHRPACDVWLIATGAEERPYTGQADHLGALRRRPARQAPRGGPAVRALARRGRARHDVPPALARATAAERRGPDRPRRPRAPCAGSPTPAPATPTTASSRSPACPAAKLGVPDDPLPPHRGDTPSRLQPRAFVKVRAIVERLLRLSTRARGRHDPLRGEPHPAGARGPRARRARDAAPALRPRPLARAAGGPARCARSTPTASTCSCASRAA